MVAIGDYRTYQSIWIGNTLGTLQSTDNTTYPVSPISTMESLLDGWMSGAGSNAAFGLTASSAAQLMNAAQMAQMPTATIPGWTKAGSYWIARHSSGGYYYHFQYWIPTGRARAYLDVHVKKGALNLTAPATPTNADRVFRLSFRVRGDPTWWNGDTLYEVVNDVATAAAVPTGVTADSLLVDVQSAIDASIAWNFDYEDVVILASGKTTSFDLRYKVGGTGSSRVPSVITVDGSASLPGGYAYRNGVLRINTGDSAYSTGVRALTYAATVQGVTSQRGIVFEDDAAPTVQNADLQVWCARPVAAGDRRNGRDVKNLYFVAGDRVDVEVDDLMRLLRYRINAISGSNPAGEYALGMQMSVDGGTTWLGTYNSMWRTEFENTPIGQSGLTLRDWDHRRDVVRWIRSGLEDTRGYVHTAEDLAFGYSRDERTYPDVITGTAGAVGRYSILVRWASSTNDKTFADSAIGNRPGPYYPTVPLPPPSGYINQTELVITIAAAAVVPPPPDPDPPVMPDVPAVFARHPIPGDSDPGTLYILDENDDPAALGAANDLYPLLTITENDEEPMVRWVVEYAGAVGTKTLTELATDRGLYIIHDDPNWAWYWNPVTTASAGVITLSAYYGGAQDRTVDWQFDVDIKQTPPVFFPWASLFGGGHESIQEVDLAS